MMPLTDLVINTDVEFPEDPDCVSDTEYGPDNSDDEDEEEDE